MEVLLASLASPQHPLKIILGPGAIRRGDSELLTTDTCMEVGLGIEIYI
jgi:hypothetical protein